MRKYVLLSRCRFQLLFVSCDVAANCELIVYQVYIWGVCGPPWAGVGECPPTFLGRPEELQVSGHSQHGGKCLLI